MADYSGPSIVDYLGSVGQPNDYASRAKLAASKGIQGYAGTAQQNTQLLNMLRGGATGQPVAQPAAALGATPTASAPSSSSRPAGGDTELQQLAKTDRNPVQESRYQQLLTEEKQKSSTSGISAQTFNQPTIDLPSLYEGLYAKSGIKDIENELSTKSKAYTERVAKIKDNPYLSEATMTGRLKKLDEKFNDDTANIRNDIATRKADVETQLNIQTKQFDINSNQVKQAWDQFNSLLSNGALDNASGEDIANITRATGISSSMIQSAIGVSQAKNAPKVNTVLQKVDDETGQYAVIINEDTGEIIAKQFLADAKPEKATGSGGSTFTPTQERAITSQARKAITSVDTNEDKRLSIAEYKKAVAKLMADAGIDFNSADDYAASAFTDLGFVKWGKGW